MGTGSAALCMDPDPMGSGSAALRMRRIKTLLCGPIYCIWFYSATVHLLIIFFSLTEKVLHILRWWWALWCPVSGPEQSVGGASALFPG